MLDLTHPLVQKILAPLLMGILGIILAWVGNQLPGIQQSPRKVVLTIKLAVEIVVFSVICSVVPDALKLLQESTDETARGIAIVLLMIVGVFPVQIGWDIMQLTGWGRRQRADAAAQTVQDLRRQLLEAVQIEVKQRRQDSLLNENLIPLQWQEHPELISRLSQPKLSTDSTRHSILQPLRRLILGERRSVSLDPTETMTDVFQRNDVRGKLLIVGEPGSGKTMTLLKLAEELVEKALIDPDAPIPILFELSAWEKNSKTRNFSDWLMAQLIERYRGIPKTDCQQWLYSGQLLPLMDGLDELSMTHQVRCIAAINQFLAGNAYPYLVVCCRSEEYEEGGVKLKELNGAVCLEPLIDDQIQSYLQCVNRSLLWGEIQQQPALQQLLQPEPDGRFGILRTPFFLRILVIAYQPDKPICNQKELLEAYIEQRLSPSVIQAERRSIKKDWAYPAGKEPNSDQTRHYMVWLAKHLQAASQTEFLIERMQPTWLDTSGQRWRYRLMAGSIFGLTLGLMVGLLIELTDRLALGLLEGLSLELTLGLIFGSLSGLLLGLINTITPIETFQLSWSHPIRKRFLSWLNIGLVYGLVYGLILGLSAGLIVSSFSGLIVGLVYGLISGLFGGLIAGSSAGLVLGAFGLMLGLRVDLKKRTQPNQGIRESAKNIIVIAILTTPLWVSVPILFGLFQNQATTLANVLVLGSPNLLRDQAYTLTDALILGSIAGLFTGLVIGGIPCFQHSVLRLILWQSGAIPRDYAQFLEYAAERKLIQRIGGRYRFIHRLLLEHFAAQ